MKQVDKLSSATETPETIKKMAKAGVGAVLVGSLGAITLGGVWAAVGIAGGAYLGWTHGKG